MCLSRCIVSFRDTKTTTGTTTKLFIRPNNLRVLALGFIDLLLFQPAQQFIPPHQQSVSNVERRKSRVVKYAVGSRTGNAEICLRSCTTFCAKYRCFYYTTLHDKGVSVKELAKCFSVNTCSIYRLLKRRNETGSYETQTSLRGKKPKLTDADHQRILSLLKMQPDITCLEIIETLDLPVSIDTVWRFLQKAGYRRKKKSLHASEQERPR